MYINKYDNFFDGIINNFYNYILEKKFFNKITKDENFVKFQNDILEFIDNFIKNLNIKSYTSVIDDKNINTITNIIKRFCAFYIYLGIGYYFKGSRDLFITNIIETSKNQKDSKINIENFYNSDNNSRIIEFYDIITYILELQEFKTIDRIKIIIENNPIKYEIIKNLFSELGEEFIETYFLIKDNIHNIIKTLIFKKIYIEQEKNNLLNILNEQEIDNAEYKYIEVVISDVKKLIDYNFFNSILSTKEIKRNIANDYYNFLLENKYEESEVITTNMIIDFLFTNKILIPISEDFLRYHKDTERYDKKETLDLKERDSTKIKYIINKINKIRNLNSSVYEKNPKLKLETMDLFYKQMENRQATLYNDLEEINIINKLLKSEQSTDLDYLVDLENIRNYAYINYKDLSKDGFILRTSNAIQSIRYTSILNNKNLELRIGHNNLPLNVVGLAFNPSGKSLECFKYNHLQNIKGKEKNGYKQFIKLLEEEKYDNNKLYYWIFDNNEDVVELDEYKNLSILDKGKYIKTMLEEIYKFYMDKIRNKIIYDLKRKEKLTEWSFEKYLLNYTNTHFSFNNINLNLNKEIISSIINNIYKDIEFIQKEEYIDDKDIIKIPFSDKIKKSLKVILLTEKKEEEIILDEYKLKPVCHHYVKWINIKKISRKNDEELNQAIFDFVKQYVKTNENNDYVCKSCDELLDLKKYVYEGTYIEELDTFLTTNLAISRNLQDIPKYSKYSRSIRNIEKNIEKIAFLINLNYYLGSTPVIKLRRKTIIKDVIDMILIHTEYLKTQPKDRIKKASENYNINVNLTNLFFFEFKDEIFLTSSTDTDYYKLIKYNNVIAYTILMLLIDFNAGILLGTKDDKRCNYFLYDKVGKTIFENLMIRIDINSKINILNIPLLCYTIFYFSCMLTNNNIWLWNTEDKSGQYNVQKIIIHTIVDLINTIVEANTQENKNFLYELITNRFLHKLKTVYNDTNLLQSIIDLSNSRIIVDKNTNKISFISKKQKKINILDPNLNVIANYIKSVELCKSKIDKMNIIEDLFDNNNLTILTNCPDGKFHEYVYKGNSTEQNFICNLCNQNYNELIKKKIDPKDYDKLDKLKNLYLYNLTKTYCLSGEIHDIDPITNICNKCKVNVKTKEYTINELKKLETNYNEIKNKQIYEEIQKSQNNFKLSKEKENKNLNIINKLNKKYIKYTNKQLNNYISDFIDKIINIIGNKITIIKEDIYIKDTKYIITNDYLGNNINKEIIILSSDDIIKFTNNHEYFKKDVIYYYDKKNNTFVYYDAITLNYLGYSKDRKKYITYKSNSYIKIIYSFKDMILNLGLNNKYSKSDNIEKILRSRINNLKQIINNILSIIQKIRFSAKIINSDYNKNINEILNEFSKKLKKFNTTNKEGKSKIFKNIDIINNYLNIENLTDNIKLEYNSAKQKDYIDTHILNKLNNSDNKLIYYLLYNLEKLIDYNEEPSIKINLIYFIIRLIIYSFNQYYIPIENIDIRKFEYIIENDVPFIDESLIIIDDINITNKDEVDKEKINEINMELQEEMTSLDIDDYDEDDMYEDYDMNPEVMDNLFE